jgi:hypothetical protein
MKKKMTLKSNEYFEGILDLGKIQFTLEIYFIEKNKERATLWTYYPLEPGHVLKFRNWKKDESAIVRHSTKTVDNNYQVEVDFVKDDVMICTFSA